jgi:hypothetical protein
MKFFQKKKKAIIHCGCYKTGTSSLQDYLFKNRDLLLNHSILYPSTGVQLNPDLGHRHYYLIYGHDKEKYLKELLYESINSSANYVIVSSEALSRPRNQFILKNIVSHFQNHNYNVEGLLYIRNYFSFAIKYYREFTIRWGNTLEFPEFIIKHKGILNYLHVSKTLKEAVDNITFVPYNKSKDIIEDFFKSTKIPFKAKVDCLGQRANEGSGFNEGSSFIAAEVFRQLKLLGLTRPKLKLNAHRIINKYFLSDSQMKKFSDGIEPFSSLVIPNKKYLKELQKILAWDSSKINSLYTNKLASKNEKLYPILKEDVSSILSEEGLG